MKTFGLAALFLLSIGLGQARAEGCGKGHAPRHFLKFMELIGSTAQKRTCRSQQACSYTNVILKSKLDLFLATAPNAADLIPQRDYRHALKLVDEMTTQASKSQGIRIQPGNSVAVYPVDRILMLLEMAREDLEQHE